MNLREFCGWLKLQGEVCHILFLDSVEYTESTEVASNPPAGSTELPTCPVCLGKIFFPFLLYSIDSFLFDSKKNEGKVSLVVKSLVNNRRLLIF